MTYPFCTACRSTYRRGAAVHQSTLRHRRATRPRFSGKRVWRDRPNWTRSAPGSASWDPYAPLPDEAYL